MPRKQIASVTLAEAIDHYARQEAHRGLIAKTVRMKRSALLALARQTPRGLHTLTRNLRREHFRDALIDLYQGASDATQTAQRAEGRGVRVGRRGGTLTLDRNALRGFVEMLYREEWISPTFRAEYEISNTARKVAPEDIRRQKVFRRIPFDEWPRLLDCAFHPRDRLLVTLGLRWTLRASSLVVLRWGDLHRDEIDSAHPYGWAELINAKSRRRVVEFQLPIGPPVAVELDRYLAWFVDRYGEPKSEWPVLAKKPHASTLPAGVPKRLMRAEWPLVPDAPMGAEQASATVKRALRAFYGPEIDLRDEAAHLLRRSGLTYARLAGGLAAAQMIASHTRDTQTQVYTGIAEPTLAEATATAAEQALRQVLLRPDAPAPEAPPVTELAPMVVVINGVTASELTVSKTMM
jgi:hypothetical protein